MKYQGIKTTIERTYYSLTGVKVVHFLHIGKTGGTAIMHALKKANIRRLKIKVHSHNVTLDMIPRGEKVFFSVRDPIKRFVSGFYSRKRQGAPTYFYPWRPEEAKAFARFDNPNELALTLTADSKANREKAINAMKAISHVNTHYWDWFRSEEYFSERFEDILFVCHQEKLQEDFEQLKSILNIPQNIELPNDGINSHRSPDSANKQLEKKAVENLRNWYSDDYSFLAFLHKKMSDD